MQIWYVGCSGFHYKSWKGVFYPNDLPQKDWLNYYCQHFNTLELNVTFYRFPQLSFLQNWYAKSPHDFCFAVKAPRIITHYKKFTGTSELLSNFYSVIGKGLQHKLGCVLFQMPPSLSYSEELLEKIIDSLDKSFLNVVEFRHVSWWRQDVYDRLAERNISFCGMSHPTLPDDVVANTPHLYYRMHGASELYASGYSHKELDELAAKIKTQHHVKNVYVYFNNDMQAHAIENTQYLQQITSR
ncbi:DUF72 domain-containing protein [Sphingobacterium sp. SGG-5]|uniref:DUF72 domain-containing protein n=1 Tax=Sphingobacterium sp. SGG-5 TaxID=2710881 RepID=UPI0013EC57C3|nr:DUF72 domain-containing protein [Sphingobacterium sp. SGG-5]NGM63381.1 DUF72 domain-containing protein [Sphingobacterium sp. SGG-5]